MGRLLYNAKESSFDAERCRKYRQSKLVVERLKVDPNNMNLL